MIAIDAAVELGLMDILGITAGDRDATIRTHTAIAASECWAIDYELGEKLIYEIVGNLNFRLLFINVPKLHVFETLVSTVFMIYFGYYQDQRSTKPLADAIRRVYTTIIPVNPNSNLGRGISVLVFRVIFSISLGLIEKATSGWDQTSPTPANLHEISLYFRRPSICSPEAPHRFCLL